MATKLGSDQSYKRPNKTYQETLSLNEIDEKLAGYVKVDNIEEVPLNRHLRYFIKQADGTEIFRLGGFLQNKSNAHKYVMLTNGKQTWSVQVADTIFFMKMSHDDEIASIHNMYGTKIAERETIINELSDYIQSEYNADFTIDKFIAMRNKSVNMPKTTQSKSAPSKSAQSKTAPSKNNQPKSKYSDSDVVLIGSKKNSVSKPPSKSVSKTPSKPPPKPPSKPPSKSVSKTPPKSVSKSSKKK